MGIEMFHWYIVTCHIQASGALLAITDISKFSAECTRRGNLEAYIRQRNPALFCKPAASGRLAKRSVAFVLTIPGTKPTAHLELDANP